jgi:hypothetical protein
MVAFKELGKSAAEYRSRGVINTPGDWNVAEQPARIELRILEPSEWIENEQLPILKGDCVRIFDGTPAVPIQGQRLQDLYKAVNHAFQQRVLPSIDCYTTWRDVITQFGDDERECFFTTLKLIDGNIWVPNFEFF